MITSNWTPYLPGFKNLEDLCLNNTLLTCSFFLGYHHYIATIYSLVIWVSDCSRLGFVLVIIASYCSRMGFVLVTMPSCYSIAVFVQVIMAFYCSRIGFVQVTMRSCYSIGIFVLVTKASCCSKASSVPDRLMLTSVEGRLSRPDGVQL
jgi:hypothetical protein